MLSIAEFYNPKMWTRLFWAWGAEYTIVKNRHIGLDIGTGRKAIDVPALLGGRVVRVRNTHAMGLVVVVQTGGDYLAYCHLSKHSLPVEGQYIVQGGRVGRLAAGPKTVNSQHVEYPGTAWGGIHLHLVHTNHPEAAYRSPRVAGAQFYDPAILIRNVLASPSGGNATPISPEEDDMPLTPAEWSKLVNIHSRIDEMFSKLTNVHTRVDQTYDRVGETYEQANIAAVRIRGFDPHADMLQLILQKLGVPVEAQVDAAALARELAPLIEASVSEMTDAEIDRVVNRLISEQARRLGNPN